MFGKLLNGVVDTVTDFVEHPIDTSIDMATQPLRDGVSIIEGLSEGEIRAVAAARLGADYISGMALGEVITLLAENLE